MTKSMCEGFVEDVNYILDKNVDTIEFYSGNKNNKKKYGYPLRRETYIGYTDRFEWDRNIEIDEVEKQLKDYSDLYYYKVMSKKEYEQWRLGNNDYKQFGDLFSPFVCVFILYR